MQRCKDLNGQVTLVQVNLAKALDRVNHECSFMLVEYVNVELSIFYGVRLCYRNCYRNCYDNLTVSIPFQSSVKQGFPIVATLVRSILRPVLFKCQEFTPWTWLPPCVLAYVDDITFCDDKPSVDRALRLTQHCCDATGVLVNTTKSYGLRFGNRATTPTDYAGITWTCMAGITRVK